MGAKMLADHWCNAKLFFSYVCILSKHKIALLEGQFINVYGVFFI